MTGGTRTWTIELPAGIELLNANQRKHWAPTRRIARQLRHLAQAKARSARVPLLERAHITAEYRPPDRRKRDVHNLYPSAKAAVDGLIDAGVLPDDNDDHLIGPDMRCGEPIDRGQLVLHIREMRIPPRRRVRTEPTNSDQLNLLEEDTNTPPRMETP